MDNLHIGQNIRELLGEKKVTVRQLADRLGMTPQGCYKLLRQAVWPTDHLLAACGLLGVDPGRILRYGRSEKGDAGGKDHLEALREKVGLLEEINQLLRERAGGGFESPRNPDTLADLTDNNSE